VGEEGAGPRERSERESRGEVRPGETRPGCQRPAQRDLCQVEYNGKDEAWPVGNGLSGDA
jgi:hypothetical protein